MHSTFSTLDFKSACALVDCGDRRGTAFLVLSDLALTCAHVVVHLGVNAEVRLQFFQGEAVAHVQQIDEENDVAVLRLRQPIAGVAVLPIAIDQKPRKGTVLEAYGFPLVTERSGLLLRGEVHDPDGRDLNGRPALVLFSQNVTSGAVLHGYSGGPVCTGGYVIGQLRQIIPDAQNGAQFGMVYACPARNLVGMLPRPVSGFGSSPHAPGGIYDPRSYVSRPHIERKAHSYLSTSGKPTILWGPERFGKTWLVERLLESWRENYPGGRIARINLYEFSSEDFATYGSFLYQFACRLAEQLQGSQQLLATEWHENDPPNSRIKKVLLALLTQSARTIADPLLVVIDHVDALLRYPAIVENFFKLLRGRTEDGQPPWPALRLLLAVSTTPSRLTGGVHSSPFENLSEPIHLDPLELEQIEALAEHYELQLRRRELSRLRDWVGGHPYLVCLFLFEAALHQRPLDELIESPPEAVDRHLRRRRELLTKNPALREALRRMIASSSCPIEDDDIRDALYNAGLIERVRGDQQRRDHYRLRGDIYREIVS